MRVASMRTRRAVALAVTLGGVGLASIALARPGGGDSYSGGGGHGGGGGGGGDGVAELIFHLLRLCIYYPQIGFPLLGVVGVVLFISWRQRVKNRDWDSGPPIVLERAIELAPLRGIDPDFSQVLFEDFAFRLFGAAHRARQTAATLAQLAPYLGPAARAELVARTPNVAVAGVVVGAQRVFSVQLPRAADDAPPGRARIGLEFEANVAAGDHTYFSVERWRFARAGTAKTRPPDPSRVFPCPNCGAPWRAAATGTQQCAYCDQIVDNGRFDWTVEHIELASIDARPPTLTGTVQERGADLPTYDQPGFDRLWLGLVHDDPALSDATVQGRVHHIYGALNRSWAANQLAPARGLVSDGLYDYLTYWIDAYRRQGLRNELVDMRITHAVMCKLVRDRWYDALTIRIWGTGFDYVVREATGEIVRGSKSRERPYSEYWTLIRSAARRGPARADDACPSCGAPRVVTMAGACEHCGAHVTAGEFDWVLSKIEQDDSYRG
jgi:hypothetical protein